MPEYYFSNPSNETDIVKVFFHMNEDKIFIKDGVKWNREWTNPQMGVDVDLNPFDSKAFVNKTGKSGGKLNDLFKRSEELSQKRAQKTGGDDPVKSDFYNKWSKERKGKKHPQQIKESRPDTYYI